MHCAEGRSQHHLLSAWDDTERETRALLDRFENDRRPRRPDALDRSDSLAEDLGQVLRIAGADLQQKAIIAGDLMRFEYFRDRGQRVAHPRFAGPVRGPDCDEGEQPLIERPGIEHGHVVADDAACLELAKTLEHRGWCQTHGPGNFRLWDSRVLLKQGQYLAINRIKHINASATE